jgi:hypothetical protein
VRKHLRTATLLALVVLLAATLTGLISGKGVVTATFQSPNPFDSALLTPTVESTATPTGTATSSPTPTLEPTALATPEPTMSPTPFGFLPPPTLTSPGTQVPAVAPSPLPGELPVRVAPTEPPASTGTNSPSQTNVKVALARLIDQGVLAVGYLWLCCGILALVGVGGALIWFFRRSRRE